MASVPNDPSPGIEAKHAIGTGVRSRTQNQEPLSFGDNNDDGNPKTARELDTNGRHCQPSARRSGKWHTPAWRAASGHTTSGNRRVADNSRCLIGAGQQTRSARMARPALWFTKHAPALAHDGGENACSKPAAAYVVTASDLDQAPMSELQLGQVQTGRVAPARRAAAYVCIAAGPLHVLLEAVLLVRVAH